MRHSDFKIGGEFYTEGGRWRCTDIGTRTIVAIFIDDTGWRGIDGRLIKSRGESWFKGPPYAVPEVVFDENDLPACRIPEDLA